MKVEEENRVELPSEYLLFQKYLDAHSQKASWTETKPSPESRFH